ncbi:ABC transporter ATP-binding protein [Candidatus Microthrix sp.]|jgi:energy-coupling factor transport system ATP-binding protein|uniref:ABC transporter ATP-binding protein n=1 Tax=Candidatus Neomicrothrix sp. TaxID=2719034 RepID=UPI001B53379A|nr:ATP-binding cassette domain-containing protein [Candidatus Microthrix sp.]MBK7322729.1 ATP-binding cassette domain-containing protein [Candidatus Microthrix sp.]MBL0202855.1 ATP-binding cassette domain-containing protein [Candidatus Microthrix sp.]MBP6136469.1 ATP-binding cassette domain-containing protein [Candidatus Microthrix sp.]MBP7879570.1 ATP-binding cassette domain-containing protein [Candidatus Microthrix sp.]MBP9621370.1 ATP-binding cassette domain-containing protein [Candidatus M
MICFDDVSFAYATDTPVVLDHVNLTVPEGDLALVIGPTGSGKSTLLGAICGLVPRFSGGVLAGSVTVDGIATSSAPPRDLAATVGYLPQRVDASFVTDVVEDELAWTMEQLGLAPDVMRRRVEDTLDLLGLADLRNRPIATLSSGQRQRVALGAVLTAQPRVLVLDEPTSALDPQAAEDVLAALTRLVGDLGLTIVCSEHRLERVVQYADSIIIVDGSGAVSHGPPDAQLVNAPVAPPVIHLGRRLGWDPLPRSVRDARRAAATLRNELPAEPPGHTRRSVPAGSEPIATAEDVWVRYGDRVALSGLNLALHPGEVTALMGRNGAGKSTLISTLGGGRAPDKGRVRIDCENPLTLRGRHFLRLVGVVPSDPTLLLSATTVAAEVAEADRETGTAPGVTAAALEALLPGIDPGAHPSDLSAGQRLGLALALVLAHEPRVVLLDEPTTGLDYRAKEALASWLAKLSSRGTAVLLATHDVELVAEVAHRAVVLADGEIVADGPATEVVTHSPTLAPQVARILHPLPYLTVDDVTAALEAQR